MGRGSLGKTATLREHRGLEHAAWHERALKTERALVSSALRLLLGIVVARNYSNQPYSDIRHEVK